MCSFLNILEYSQATAASVLSMHNVRLRSRGVSDKEQHGGSKKLYFFYFKETHKEHGGLLNFQ
jgi:hypothetical protein